MPTPLVTALYICLVTFVFFSHATTQNTITSLSELSSVYSNCAVLDETLNYRLYWSLNETHINIAVKAEVSGWIALGISQNGQMNSGGSPSFSDIILGWVDDNGDTHVGDYWVDRYQKPTLDDEQNIFDIGGFETSNSQPISGNTDSITSTAIMFTRRLSTSDSKRDVSIDPEKPLKIIWAVNSAFDATSKNEYSRHDFRGPNAPGIDRTLASWVSDCPKEKTIVSTRGINETAIREAVRMNNGLTTPDCTGSTRTLLSETDTFTSVKATYLEGRVFVKKEGTTIEVTTANPEHTAMSTKTNQELDIVISNRLKSQASDQLFSILPILLLMFVLHPTKYVNLMVIVMAVSSFCLSSQDCVVLSVPDSVCKVAISDINGERTLELCANKVEVHVESSADSIGTQNIVKGSMDRLSSEYSIQSLEKQGNLWIVSLYITSEDGVVDFVSKSQTGNEHFISMSAKYVVVPGLDKFTVSQCNSTEYCNAKGACRNTNDPCDCDTGYVGDNCQFSCPGRSWDPCRSNGVCTADNDKAVCVCKDGFGGDNCQFECLGKTGNSYCSGNGICDKSTGQCVCTNPWAGSDCSAHCPGCRIIEITMPPDGPPIENGTSYFCHNSFFSLSGNLSKHIVRIEAIIDNKELAHHCVVLRRGGGIFDSIFGKPQYDPTKHYYKCFDMPAEILLPISGWASGANDVSLPRNVGTGFDILSDNDTVAAIIQMHYDNPGNLQGQYDQSGIRVFMTDELRQYNSGIMAASFNSKPGPEGILRVPPQSTWEYTNYCPPRDLQIMYSWRVMIERTETEKGIPTTFLSHNGHMHEIGKKWKSTKQKCDYTTDFSVCADEANWVDTDIIGEADPYDYNDQKTVLFNDVWNSNERIKTHFLWDAEGKDTWTFNGPASTDEMGSVAFSYYPAFDYFVCMKGSLNLLGQFPFLGFICGTYCHDPRIEEAPYFGWKLENQGLAGGCIASINETCPGCYEKGGEMMHPGITCFDGGLTSFLTGEPAVFPTNPKN